MARDDKTPIDALPLEALDLPPELVSIIRDTDWRDLNTARGDASAVPQLLQTLFAPDAEAAFRAASDLDDLLCHQHVMLADASLPATPILLHALKTRDEPLVLEELLFILDGFAIACSATTWQHGEPDYLKSVCRRIEAQRDLISSLVSHADKNVAESAEVVLERLDKAARQGLPAGAASEDQ